MTEPKVAVATTTINIPTALELMHAYGKDVALFVAGDMKTPEPQCADFVNKLGGNAYYLSVEHQKSLNYACSDLIGWNCIQRRNIAILESLKWGADIIVLWDDDNIAMNSAYFDNFVSALSYPFDGVAVRGYSGWFDVGQLLDPVAPHRGFPSDVAPLWSAGTIVNAKVGVAAGICMGDPDIDAFTRLANRAKPLDVHRASQLLDAGIVVRSDTKTIFNSQNTAFIRELAPAMCMLPGLGRYDDIFASLICQCVMQERKLHVHFGHPYIWQSRNPHNLISDLKAEVFGMEHVHRFSKLLDGVLMKSDDVVDDVEQIAQALADADWFPKNTAIALHAWLEDIETVMK